MGTSCTAREAAGLAARVQAAADRFEAVSEADLQSARRELGVAAIAVERSIGIGSAGGRAWADYLAWGGLQDQLTGGSEPDLAALRTTVDQLTSGTPGLERPEFQRAAAAAERLRQLGYARRSSGQSTYLSRVARSLATQLGRAGATLAPRASYRIEQRLARLAAAGQQPELLAAIDRSLRRPNTYVGASEGLLGRFARRPVQDTRPLDDVILGTKIVGSGVTCGHIGLDLRPAGHAARLAFRLDGSVASSTRGYNGPVVIRSVGDTPFCGAKVIDLTDDRFTVLPASVHARTSSRTRSITKKGGALGKRLVEAIAAKRVAESRGRANAIASRKAELRIAEEFDSQVLDEVRQARRAYDTRLRGPLRRRGAGLGRVALATTENRLLASALLARPGLLGADTGPPPEPGGDVDVRLHQSAMNNLADALLGGVTISKRSADGPIETDALLPPRLRARLAGAPPAGDGGPPFRPWLVQLRRERPLSFYVDGGAIRVLAHTRRLELDGRPFNDGWDIELTYQLVKEQGRWKARLVGEFDVIPTSFDPTVPGARLKSEKFVIRRNLAKLLTANITKNPNFSKEIDLGSVDLTSAGKRGLSGLFTEVVTAERGWLSVSMLAY